MEPIPLVDLAAQDATVGERVRAAVLRVANHRQFILGAEVEAFEAAMAERYGVCAAVGVASGSDALFLALTAAGIGPGDEVVTSAFSFFATAAAIQRTGATPRFVDIEPDGFNLDPARIEQVSSNRTRAIIPVHLFGRVAKLEPIVEVTRRRGWTLIEDAAQSIDASRRGRAAGTVGEFGCFSFHPTKNLGGWGDGGMVFCATEASAAAVRRLRAHGGDAGVHEVVGINSRLDALQAAVLSAKLPLLESWSVARRERAARYRTELGRLRLEEHLRIQEPDREGVEVVHHFVVRCRRRDELRAHLVAKNIGVGVYYPRPLHLQPCFLELGGKPGDQPNAERAATEVLSLPLYPELTDAQQDRVVAAIEEFYRGSSA